MSKMGWQPGKGLGLLENGNTDNIAVRLKENNLGIGADKNTADNWLQTASDFDALLKKLNETVGSDSSDKKTSKKRQSDDVGSIRNAYFLILNWL